MDDRGMDNKLSALGDFEIEGFCSVWMLLYCLLVFLKVPSVQANQVQKFLLLCLKIAQN